MTAKSKRTSAAQPTRHHLNVLGQLLKYIPRSIVYATAARYGVDAKARTFSVFSHMAAMVFVQLAHALSLNDVCDWLRLKVRAIAGLGMTPPSRNNLSHANKVRPAGFMETVFWKTLEHLQRCEPGFGGKRRGRLLHRFKAKVHAVDSTTIELVANCMDWAQHRRRSRSPREGLRQTARNELPAGRRSREAATESTQRPRCICA